MNAILVASHLCRDTVRRVAQRGDRDFIVSSFRYPDGDFVSVYPHVVDADLRLTDRGNTLFKLRLSGVKLTDARLHLLNAIQVRYGIHRDRSQSLWKDTRMETVGTDYLSFCEAVVRISTLEYESLARARSYFPDQVDRLVHERIEVGRSVLRCWTHPQYDPNQSYPVDYRLNGSSSPRHVFHVASREKSTLVAAVSNFLRAKGVLVPTMSVLDPDVPLHSHQMDRLQLACDEIKIGLAGNEDAIVRFALETGETARA